MMLEIDASQGEGGGQILRTSMALAMLTQTPVKLEHIRAGRKKPGLMRQHLTAVRAAAQVSRGSLTGDDIGSCELTFNPGEIQAQDATFKIGTAGSTCLVLQTLLPAFMCAEERVTLTIEGGTHNPMAPNANFLTATFAPQLAKIGPRLHINCARHGFYPAGGGKLVATIEPVPRADFKPFELHERGRRLGQRGVAMISSLPPSIAEREAATLSKLTGWLEQECVVEDVPSAGPGNLVMARVDYEHISEHFSSFGKKGKAGEIVVKDLVGELRGYLASDAPVGEYLADQLLLPMSLGKGGSFTCTPPSLHTRTQAEMIEKFLEVEIRFERVDDRIWKTIVEV
jgi:RNA 3'-terminal phosphate cyclase (ATP)